MILEDLTHALAEARSFTDADVDDDDLTAILEAARLAPSAMNSQIWRFFVVKRGGRLDRLAALAGVPAFRTAPVVVVACAAPYFLKKRGREQPYFMIDVPIAVTHLLLSAADLGLGGAVTYRFDEGAALTIVGAPERYRGVALAALGYAGERDKGKNADECDAVEIR
jgi:nitroreductase